MMRFLKNPLTRHLKRWGSQHYNRLLDRLIKNPVARPDPVFTYLAPLLFPAQKARARRREMYITTVGKNDGAGAQIQAVFSTMLFAQMQGFTYVHTPFTAIEHADNPLHWASQWETFMGLGYGEMPVEALPPETKRVQLASIGRLLGRAGTLYLVPHCHPYADAFPDQYILLKERFSQKYHHVPKNVPHFNDPTRCNVAIHIRRGDVTPKTHPLRYTADSYNLTVLEKIQTVLRGLGIDPLIHVYSQGAVENFSEYARREMCLHINESAFATFHAMVTADILVMSKSSFSYSAALLSTGIVFYQKFWHTPLREWINTENNDFGFQIQPSLLKREYHN